MYWKTLSVLLIVYTLIAGMRAPLKAGIQRCEPAVVKTGDSKTITMIGYNTFFLRETVEPTRVWLTFDDKNAILAKNTRMVNDTVLEADFVLPPTLPNGKTNAMLNVIADHPPTGTAILPNAVAIVTSDSVSASLNETWSGTPVGNLHVQTAFSYPYQNVIYETIRNTYFHVPMWFVLMFLFLASVIFSVIYLIHPSLENDRRAVAFTETGILFGFLGLFTGMVWANYTWGQPWSGDIKQTMTAVALLIYLAYFILRKSFDEPEKGARLAAVYNIFAFASLIPLLYIVPRMFASLHPGAEGNPAFGTQDLDNTMRMVFYPAIIGWTLMGFWLAQLRFRYQRVYDHVAGLER